MWLFGNNFKIFLYQKINNVCTLVLVASGPLFLCVHIHAFCITEGIQEDLNDVQQELALLLIVKFSVALDFISIH